MSSGAGHIIEMINRLRSNESLLRKRQYFELRKKYLGSFEKKEIHFRKATKEEMKAVREKIKRQKKIELQRNILILILSIITTAVLISAIIFFIRRSF